MSEPMPQRTTLYPYELTSLLEEVFDDRLTGTVTLETDDGAILLYAARGLVRYARTNRVADSFPAYVLEAAVFSKAKVKSYLKTCIDDGSTLDQLLVEEGEVTAEDLRYLKRGLAMRVFARAFSLPSEVAIEPTDGQAGVYRLAPMDPFEALFTGIERFPDQAVIGDTLGAYWGRPLRRGPDFFGLLAAFERVFGASPLVAQLDEGRTLADLRRQTPQLEPMLRQAFGMHVARMMCFGDEDVRSGALAAELGRQALFSSPDSPAKTARKTPAVRGDTRLGKPVAPQRIEVRAHTRQGSQPGLHRRTKGSPAFQLSQPKPPPPLPTPPVPFQRAEAAPVRVSAPTPPHGGPLAAPPQLGHEVTQPKRPAPSPAPQTDLRQASPPPAPAPDEWSVRGLEQHPEPARDPSAGRRSLQDSLVSESLIRAAEQALEEHLYTFFGVTPDVPFSRLRAAYLRTWAQYDDSRYAGHDITPEARRALQEIHARIDRGYEQLTGRQSRVEHDRTHGIRFDRAALGAMFDAEELFNEAQLRMSEGDNHAAVDLLMQAIKRFAGEPEYWSYLAWALTCAGMWGKDLPRGCDPPDELLERALRMDERLESAWIFRGRMAEVAGDLTIALTAFTQTLLCNPDNQEAQETVQRLRAAGIELAETRKQTLAERLSGLFGRFGRG